MLELRDYQSAAIAAVYGYFERATGNPLLVLPTAAGKSLINAALIQGILAAWPDQRILCLTHVRELIVQNFKELVSLWPEAPAGINSASVGQRDTMSPILFAGIQSVYKKAMHLGWFDLIIVDEAHLIPAKATGMYREFLDAAKGINPHLKVIGLTATPYRLGQGMLTQGEDRLFTDIAYDVPVRLLIDRGYLAPLVTPASGTDTKISMEGVGVRGGEFVAGQMASAVDRDTLTQAAVSEIIERGADRKSWLIFCSSVAHAEHVSDAINDQGVLCDVITGKTPKVERDQTIQNFKEGYLRALCNVDVLTTGFNAPNVDLIAFLRPTQSPGLYLQMVGRGMRQSPATGKRDCLVLDFAGNIERHGPVDNVRPPRAPSGKGGGGGDMVKVCDQCGAEAHISASYCPTCLEQFPVRPVHEERASNAPIMSDGKSEARIDEYEVTDVDYQMHIPRAEGKRISLRVDYFSGYERVCSEWICFEHDGYARKKAEHWWVNRIEAPVPATVEEALQYADILPRPIEIRVDSSERFPRILAYEFGALELPIPIPDGWVPVGAQHVMPMDAGDFEDYPF